MGKRDRSLSDVAEDYIEWLEALADACDATARRKVRKLARDLESMAIRVDGLVANSGMPIKRKMGRHANITERERNARFDLKCYERTQQLHEGGLSWTDAFEKAGEEVHKSADAVRKARSRAKRLFA